MSVIDNAIKQLWKDGIKIVKLWENASPSSAFAAQTIPLDTEGYEEALVLPMSTNGLNGAFIVRKNEDRVLYSAGGHPLQRRYELTDSGLTVQAGDILVDSGWQTNNQAMKPYIIYGLKFLLGGGYRIARFIKSLFFHMERRCA